MNIGKASSESATAHRWKFAKIGGVLQVVFRSGEDIVNLEQLDQKLWVALACPTRGVEFDERTLDLLDLDGDARVRAPEVIAVTRWLRDVLTNHDELVAGRDSVALTALNTKTPAGAGVLSSARRVLARSNDPDADAITLANITEFANTFSACTFNGDGVLPADSASDDTTRRAIQDIISTHTGTPDRSGKLGLTLGKLDAFLAEANALLAWSRKAEADAAILPLGEKTVRAVEAIQALRPKLNDFFARTRLATFDQRAAPILNRAEADFLALTAKDLRTDTDEIAQLPLAHIAPGGVLPLTKGVNPAWQEAVAKFATNAVAPILGANRDSITEQVWIEIQQRLGAHEQWLASKPITPAEKLGVPRLREMIESGVQEKIRELIQKDAAETQINDDIKVVEKLVRVHRDILRFLNNFVSFHDFYSRRGAIFQAGTLYLDARSCELCVPVTDPAKHALLAGLSKAFLAYCDCTRVGGKKMTIAAAFTAGDSDNLMVGRNGVFYDRDGLDWDATITRIVENPISIPQAFWSPYKKFIRMIEEQVAKRASAAEAASQAKLGTAATAVASVDLAKTPRTVAPVVKPEAKRFDVGTIAALGVALGSLATFLGLIFTRVLDLGWWSPFAVIGLVLVISIPSMLIAWLKLRQRNLGPILDANGWAVNGRMKINVPFGGALSKRATLPSGAQVQFKDPYYESHAGRYAMIALIVLVIALGTAWRMQWLDRLLPASLQRRPQPIQMVPVQGADAIVPAIQPATTNQ